MIKIVNADKAEIKIDRKEVLRYLGYKGSVESDESLKMIEQSIKEVEQCQKFSACYDNFPISVLSDKELDLGFGKINSKSLKKNLSGCDEIIVFAATIGIEVDRLIRKYTMISPSRAVAVQAAGAASIEKWCDELCRRFADEQIKRGKYLRPRFSPGYGDFPLEAQKNIFSVLDCERKIGIALTESNLMIPTKSVSALVGISRRNSHCKLQGCEICENEDCEFRRF